MNRPLAPISPETLKSRGATANLIRLPYLKIRKYLRTYPNQYPRFLYKYISPEICDDWLADYLLDSYFWLSSPTTFNDPFDMQAHVINQGDVLQKRKRWTEIVKKNAPQLNRKQRDLEISWLMASKANSAENIQKIFQRNSEKVGLSCLSEDPRSLLMWSHYAKQHKGVVLQFEIAKDPEALLHVMKVNYSDEYPSLNFAIDMGGQLGTIMQRKFTDWKYEKEWRLLIINGASTYLKFKPEALTRVIFGCKADDSIKLKVDKILAKRNDKKLPALNLYSAKMHPSQYQIVIERKN